MFNVCIQNKIQLVLQVIVQKEKLMIVFVSKHLGELGSLGTGGESIHFNFLKGQLDNVF